MKNMMMPKGMTMPAAKGAKSAKAMPFPAKAGTTMGRMKMQGKKPMKTKMK